MTNRKLIVCDMDGTILPEGHNLSSNTINFIKYLNSKGHMVVLATGRPLRIVIDFYNELDLNSPIICYNGALLTHPKDNNFPVYSKKFDKDILKTISQKSDSIIYDSFCESLDTLFTERSDEKLNFYFDYINKDCKKGRIKDVLNEDVYNCCLVYDHNKYNDLETIVRDNSNYEIRLWHADGYCELFNPGADKGSCVERIMNIYNFKKDDVIAFGDGENDRTMLSAAGLGFCMKNSRCPYLKNDFKNTEYTSLEDGVVEELKKLFQ